jgi:hypothetical protein
MTGLPTGVQSQLDAAKAMIERGNATQTNKMEVVQENIVDMPSTVSTPVPPAPVPENPQPTAEIPVTTEPTPEQGSQLESLRQEVDQLRHANAVLMGKYNAEVPRLQQRLKELTAENDTLMRRITQQPTTTTASEPLAQRATITDEEVRRRFSKDIIDEDGMERCRETLRIAREEAESRSTRENDSVRRDLDELREERFKSELRNLVPNFEAIDDDPKFREWLSSYDPMSGMTYRQCGESAWSNRDAVRVAHIMNTWKGQTQSPATSSGRPSLQSQVVPKVQSPAQTTQKHGKTYTLAQWSEEMSKIPGMPLTERDARQKELEAAFRDGRVK